MTNAEINLMELIRELYPICRSITGDGVRETLAVLSRGLPISIHEVPSGTQVLDWTVPREWNMRDAYVLNSRGEKLIDFHAHNLHVVNYSSPIDKEVSREELLEHLHTSEQHPDWIPYRTTYYREDWGFCVAAKDMDVFTDDRYRVVIDASLEDGALTYGELLIPGELESEILFYSHTCHPSLANDNLSGLAITTGLARELSARKNRYSYRFVWGPGTIGSITWLSRNEDMLHRIVHGLVVVLLGDSGNLTYKRSQRGNARIDSITKYVVDRLNGSCVDFEPYGYDERQFCSPGFNLPVGRLSRTPNGEYPEYHSSGDNLDLLDPSKLSESLEACREIVNIIENDEVLRNTEPKGEPQLGRRGLYRNQGGEGLPNRENAMLWILNQADGSRSLLDIAIRSGVPFKEIRAVSDELRAAGLLEPATDAAPVDAG